jgi:hypothetical protein
MKMPLMISRIGHARGLPVAPGFPQVRRDHAHSRIGQIGLVSGYNAAMLSSNSRRPHGESRLVQQPPGITADASDTTLFQELPFSRTASDNGLGD